MYKWRITVLLFLPVALGIAQTRIELSTQSNGDFSRAQATKPAKAGTSLPLTCSAGEVFFKLDATAGQNLFVCAPANTWTQLTSGSGGGGGAGAAYQLSDLFPIRASNTALTIASGCGISTPCNIDFGGVTQSLVHSATVTISNTPTGTLYVWIGTGPTITVGVPSGFATATCDGNCVIVTLGAQAFPNNVRPVAIWNVAAGSWASTGTDMRAFQSVAPTFAAGANMTVTYTGGVVTYASTGGGGGGGGAGRKSFYYPACTYSTGSGGFPTSTYAIGLIATFNGDEGCIVALSANGATLMWEHWIPSSWDGNTVTAKLLWKNAGGSGNVQWDFNAVCIASGSALGSTSYHTVSTTVPVIAGNLLNTTTVNLDMTGCSPDSLLRIQLVSYGSGMGGTTYSGNPELRGLRLSLVE